MIVYGCVVGDGERYLQTALPGIRRAGGPQVEPIVVEGGSSIFTACEEIAGRALERGDLEALVLVHDDVEILDPGFGRGLRAALAAGAGVVGVIGGIGVADMGWWRCERPLGRVRWRRPAGDESVLGPGGEGPVDAIDGLLMAFSAEALARLRFDEANLGPGFHGYDADICAQAHAAGIEVRVAALDCVHVNDGIPSPEDRAGWVRAHAAFHRKWERGARGALVLSPG